LPGFIVHGPPYSVRNPYKSVFSESGRLSAPPWTTPLAPPPEIQRMPGKQIWFIIFDASGLGKSETEVTGLTLVTDLVPRSAAHLSAGTRIMSRNFG
jgi:hypothetical protein